jgi:TonB family protein
MKKFFSVLFLFLLFSTTTFSQEEEKVVLINDIQVIDSETEIFPLTLVDQAPAFPNCKGVVVEKSQECFQTELMNHLKKNFKYPELAMEENIQGRFIAKFIIDENGSVIIQEIVGSDEAEILKEQVKIIILKLPKFEPAKHKGNIVKVKHSLPLTFKLQ